MLRRSQSPPRAGAPPCGPPSDVASAARKRTVLLVEDDVDNAEAIAELLRLHDYEVRTAGSVREAIVRAGEGFDVLVSDIGLPDGTGRDVIRELAARGAVQAIALTGDGAEDDVQANADAGFARHLTKPVDPGELVAAIEELTSADSHERRPPRAATPFTPPLSTRRPARRSP